MALLVEKLSRVLLSGVELVGELATDEVSAAAGGANVVDGAALDAVLVPQVPAHDDQGDAGHHAGQQTEEDAALAHLLSILVRLAEKAKRATKTVSAVVHATAEAVLPVFARALALALSFAPAFTFAHLS